MSAFTHLHVASAFSAQYGTAAPEQFVRAAAEAGAGAAAITDRDGLYGAVRHIRACIEANLAPIVGVDLRLSAAKDDTSASRRNSVRATVLAHGQFAGQSWAGLCRLISAAHTPPRGAAITARRNWLPQLPVGRFAPFLRDSAGEPLGTVLLGPDSDVGVALAAGDTDTAVERLKNWQRQLPGGVVVEIVCHLTQPGTRASLAHAATMLEFAHRHRIPAALTNQVRYLVPDDTLTGDVLDSAVELQPLGAFVPQPNAQAWFKPPARMRALAELIVARTELRTAAADRLLATTEQLAERCQLDPETDLRWQQPKVPEPEVLGIRGDPALVLEQRTRAAITERFPDASSHERRLIEHRLGEELATIREFGFDTYFLAVADVTDAIHEMGVRNQARGSGASSLVNYLLRISNVNPLEHRLLFERFLGRRRSTLPDIDIDVESARRHDVYRMIFQRYGRERTALLSMHSTYRARGAARDAGLALGIAPERIDAIAKSLWRFDAGAFRQALQEKPELANLAIQAQQDRDIGLLIDLAARLDRLPRHLSMHPCGVLIGNDSLLSTTPVQPSGAEFSATATFPMSQFDKDDIDDMGLLKLDVLGVRMQSAIAYALNEVERIHGAQAAVRGGLPPDARYVTTGGRLLIDEIPKTDEATFEQIRSTNTLGMFQIESPGQRELIGKMQPDRYDDLIADISLFRPGPMKGNMVGPFLDVKHGFAQPEWLHPRFRPFLAETYGVVVYHEQVLHILHECMGIDLAEADELRRLMEKRGASIEQRFRRETAANRDVHGRQKFTDRQIDRIWEVLQGFGSFGFCKAHAAAFALPTWQSAWLKTHYPAEFFAGLLTHDPGMYPKRLILADARRMGVPILPLDVSRSTDRVVVERIHDTPPGAATRSGDLGLRLSLSDVRGITRAELARILTEQPFTSLGDFFERARPSRSLAENLAVVGALDSLEPSRPTRGELITEIRARRRRPQRKRRPDELELPLQFAVEQPPVVASAGVPEMSKRERVRAELEVLALDLSEHVIDGYRPLLDELGVTAASELGQLRGGTEVTVAGVRVATQTPPMRTGKRVVFISVDDGSGCADTTFFEDAQRRSGEVLFGTPLLLIRGRVRRTGERGVSINAEQALDLKQLWESWTALRANAVSDPTAQERSCLPTGPAA